MRLIIFADDKLNHNIGVMDAGQDFADITELLPEFPEKLHQLLELDDTMALLKDALHYKHKTAVLGGVKLKAPLCLEKYLWFCSQNGAKKGLYLQALRGVKGPGEILRAPLEHELGMIPHIVFTAGGILSNANAAKAAKIFKGFTLLNLGVATPLTKTDQWLGLASQLEGFSAAGPWLWLGDCGAFLRGQFLELGHNGHARAINLNGVWEQALAAAARLSHAVTITPGDMLAVPLCAMFKVNPGDSVALHLPGFGRLENAID